MSAYEISYFRNEVHKYSKELFTLVSKCQQLLDETECVKVPLLRNSLSSISQRVNSLCNLSNQSLQDYFQSLPEEVLNLILDHLTEFKWLGTLSCVSKRFNRSLQTRDDLWKTPTLEFWKKKGFPTKGFHLEWGYKKGSSFTSRINWKWFAQCFLKKESFTWADRSNEDKEYVSLQEIGEVTLEFRLKKSHVLIGTVVNSKFNGPGGYFVKNGDRFSGNFLDEKKHGHGCYVWDDGAQYEGEYREGVKHGHGVFNSPDGFKYDGEWVDGQPLIEDEAVHPGVRECLAQGYCTLAFTQKTTKFPQVRYRCKDCSKFYCFTCWTYCHANIHLNGHTNWEKKWWEGGYCTCGDSCSRKKEQVTTGDEEPPLKRLRTSME